MEPARVRGWAGDVASRFGYTVDFLPIGDEDAQVGPPTQMAVFGDDTYDSGTLARGSHRPIRLR
jgi:hypothetical protein